jgi:hypothetical protein
MNDDEFVRLVVRQASQIAGGYSISHASGRFRAGALLSRSEAGRVLVDDGRYLVDETTAVVRFIVPLETGSAELKVGFEEAQASLFSVGVVDVDALEAELRTVRMLFFQLFVEAVVRTIEGEDEIWLVESGPKGRRLYTWSRQG